MKIFLLPMLAMPFLIPSCDIVTGRHIRGNGKVETENRSESNFRGVHSYGSFDVYLTTSDAYSVKVEADANLLQYIETSVDDDVLKITTASGVSLDPVKGIKIYVSAPQFRKLASSGSGNMLGQNQLVSPENMELGISGSGNLEADLKASEVSASISGSGNMTLQGEAKSFKSSIAGNGDIRARKLQTEEASIGIAGSGDVEVNASKELDVHVAGSGDVKYVGSPAIHQHIAGSGSIQKID